MISDTWRQHTDGVLFHGPRGICLRTIGRSTPGFHRARPLPGSIYTERMPDSTRSSVLLSLLSSSISVVTAILRNRSLSFDLPSCVTNALPVFPRDFDIVPLLLSPAPRRNVEMARVVETVEPNILKHGCMTMIVAAMMATNISVIASVLEVVLFPVGLVSKPRFRKTLRNPLTVRVWRCRRREIHQDQTPNSAHRVT